MVGSKGSWSGTNGWDQLHTTVGKDPSRSAGPGPKVAGPIGIPARSPPPGHFPGRGRSAATLAVTGSPGIPWVRRGGRTHLPNLVSSSGCLERVHLTLEHWMTYVDTGFRGECLY